MSKAPDSKRSTLEPQYSKAYEKGIPREGRRKRGKEEAERGQETYEN